MSVQYCILGEIYQDFLKLT